MMIKITKDYLLAKVWYGGTSTQIICGPFCITYWKGGFWFRIFGWGCKVKHNASPLLFSERQAILRGELKSYFGYYISKLKPKDK